MFYPVIMCGGSGTRLWPLSRAARPKQFIPLVGERSPFQATLIRLAKLEGAAAPLVVAGLGHAEWIVREAEQAGVPADMLLEPLARDSGPAVAAAAAWIAERDPKGVAVIVASDHHIPDDEAFLGAVKKAGVAAAQGWVVTLGIDPAYPATAYGYIQPGDVLTDAAPVRRNQAFVEKPDAATAAAYLKSGYLWNSGNFIARADVLLGELDRHEPAVAAAARTAVATAEQSGRAWRLGGAFAEAPKISFDYAVMERTDRAAVLPVSFAWSDLGAWDAVWAASAKDEAGNAADPQVLLQEARECLVRSAGGLEVALVGVNRLAVIADAQSLLICGLDSSQGVKAAAEAAARGALRPQQSPVDLLAWFERYEQWFRTAALPVWWSLGADHAQGGFHEVLEQDGVAPPRPRRARVQARQAFVYAKAAALGLPGPWLQAAEHGWRYFERRYRRADGLYRTLVGARGEPLDDKTYLYDQAFALLAMAGLREAGSTEADWAATADALLGAVRTEFGHAGGGFRETGEHPFQSNPLMHLLEAAMAWVEVDGGLQWRDLGENLVTLALDRLIDPAGGFLREYFDAAWNPAAGEQGRLVQPGHQFEWAWLLDRWSLIAGSDRAAAAALRLHQAGLAGWDQARGVAVDEIDDGLGIRCRTARLWPQTEALKASIMLGLREGAEPRFFEHAAEAAAGLWRYLETPIAGLWRDTIGADGQFMIEAAPGSSFYHVVGAILALHRYHGRRAPSLAHPST